MSPVTALPLFRLIWFYISGMLLAICYPTDLFITLILLVALSTLYLSIAARTISCAWLNPIGLLLIFLVGYSNLLLQVGQQKKGSTWGHPHLKGYRACIQKVYHPHNCQAAITHIKDDLGWHNSRTPIQLYFSKPSAYKPKKGDTLLVRGTPIHALPSHPMQQAVPLTSLAYPSMHRHVLKQINQDFIVLQSLDQNRQWATMITQWCSDTLHQQLKDRQAIALVTTLLWGEKEDLNPALQKAYVDTGTIHVLAISGLHVGMFYLLMQAIFRFLFSHIGGLILPGLFTLLWLWLYAWLCHFAPPILRATMMITIARIGFLMGRGFNRYNGWMASAFALLLWNPLLLWNCGFQLSYMATLGILYLQPYIHRLLAPKNYGLQKIWTATTLSIAAQVATLPLILYYFKQFPLYFILANWLVVPAIFAILILSLALLAGSHLPIMQTCLSSILSFTLEKLIAATNAWVCWLAKWPMCTLKTATVNGYAACLLYIILFSICLFLHHKHLIYPVIISLCTLLYSVEQIQIRIAKQKKCKLICYNNDQLSFTLKDGIERLHCDRALSEPICDTQWLGTAQSTAYSTVFKEYTQTKTIKSPLTTALQKPANDLPCKRSSHYAGGIIATWDKKVILTLHQIPVDWYGWNRAKLDADYLLINADLLQDIAIICKVLHMKTLVIYTQQDHALRYHPNIKQLGILPIWLKPGAKKTLTWLKNL
ncbi:ComEC/Rec2 family competence protein [Candidatus Cardinium sp. TP]|uniref:ComEC/Rec2 family competence protein n=1 Tax=Candidatus Cardinium sp. TP TaxID=2961955 RepID=UPI0021AF68AD|nr:ComEC/Rec2 family competence protein [Candidatus Cardinium sp. TP]MCT4697371.1 ComEC/Rec2 family competence protein [Candidatus Cardinium sp. TP]